MQRGVRIAAPEGLHQGGRGVIHSVAALVIAHGAFLPQLYGVRFREKQRPVFGKRRLYQQFHGVNRLAHVPAARERQTPGNCRFPLQRKSGAFAFPLQRPQNRPFRRFRGNRLKLKDGTPGQQRPVHIEIRIFRRGGNQGQFAVFHEFQQALLLFLVEILDFVQIQQDAAGGQQRPHVRDNLLDIRKGRGCRVQAAQSLLRAFGDDVGNRGLAGAGRPVEHHVGFRAARNQPTQNRAGGKQMFLPHNVFQRIRADFIRQRLAHTLSPSFPAFLFCFLSLVLFYSSSSSSSSRRGPISMPIMALRKLFCSFR